MISVVVVVVEYVYSRTLSSVVSLSFFLSFSDVEAARWTKKQQQARWINWAIEFASGYVVIILVVIIEQNSDCLVNWSLRERERERAPATIEWNRMLTIERGYCCCRYYYTFDRRQKQSSFIIFFVVANNKNKQTLLMLPPPPNKQCPKIGQLQ